MDCIKDEQKRNRIESEVLRMQGTLHASAWIINARSAHTKHGAGGRRLGYESVSGLEVSDLNRAEHSTCN